MDVKRRGGPDLKISKTQKVLVLGMGVTGLKALMYVLEKGAKALAVNQGKFSEWAQFKEIQELQKLYPETLSISSQEDLVTDQPLDLILLSPGIARESECLKIWLARGVPVVNEIELAHREWRDKSKGAVFAITGSNGKTTTTLMLDHLLQKLGLKTFAGGNLGTPFCHLFLKEAGPLPEVCTLELSSFQLESLFEFTSEACALLNLSFTHGERYSNYESYARAKFRMGLNLRPGALLIHPALDDQSLEENRWMKEWISSLASQKIKCLEIPMTKEELLSDLQKIYELNEFELVGSHNLQNLWVATKLLLHQYPEQSLKLKNALRGFRGAAHRLEPVPVTSGRKVFNDAKSTNWSATKIALKAMEELAPVHLILGGQLRGLNDEIGPHLMSITAQVKALWLYGESGAVIERELGQTKTALSFQYFKTLEELIREFSKQTDLAPLVFSPAFPSFDQFQNYGHRGECFKAWVKDFL